MTCRKKLIEVALPLEEINIASAREKSIRHGHPSTLHLWWARRPLATCRAVLFSSIIDDPGEEGVPLDLLDQIDALPLHHKYRHLAEEEPLGPDGEVLAPQVAKKEKLAKRRRYQLFTFIERLVTWENSNDPDTLEIARSLIHAATGGNPPPVLDPFCGGGSIPLEAQRLGLEAHGSDLNPVAVLITKALIEIPPKFADQPPINPKWRQEQNSNLGGSAWEQQPPIAKGFEAINEYGHRFNMPAYFDGKTHVDLQDQFLSMSADWQRTGRWQGSILDLRGALLYFVREQHHYGMFPEPDSERMQMFSSLYSEIRKRWEEGPWSNRNDFTRTWCGAQGMAEDVRYYGQWMRDQAEQRICHLYPKVEITAEMAGERPDLKPLVGQKLTVIAWLWARTVPSPDPAAKGAHIPLVRSFVLSSKKAKEAWVEPVVDREAMAYRFEVRTGIGRAPNGTIGRLGGRCILTGTPLTLNHVRAEGKAGHMSERLMAIVAEGARGRVYLSPNELQEHAAAANPVWRPSLELPHNPRDFKTPGYGHKTFGDLFTDRQLVALTTFSDLVGEAREKVLADASAAGLDPTRSTAYANAIATYLAFLVDQMANHNSCVCGWNSANTQMRSVFARQAIPMVWDFAESNPLCESSGSFYNLFERAVKGFEALGAPTTGVSEQADATKQTKQPFLFSTDPPYFDNIGYADLSDFFYVWLRRSLGDVYPDLFSTVVTPKTDELIATPYRHEGSKQKATEFFETGLREVFRRMRNQGIPEYPTTVYYAFKQSETEEGDDDEGGSETASTGWETMLQGLVDTGFSVNGTWPTRTEKPGRMIAEGTNALASCIVLVCCPRPDSAESISRRQFVSILSQELKPALVKLTQGNLAPVDLAQAAIGPGMAVFSRYSSVLEADGKPMKVRTALGLINQALEEALSEQEGWYDSQTRWAVTWFKQRGFQEGPYGEAETLATAKDAPVNTLAEAGIIRSSGGKVKLLSREELNADYDPANDKRTTIWEATQYVARALDQHGELGAARMMRRFRETKPDLDVDRARELAYRLYAICDQKRWTQEARVYNALVLSWSDIEAVSQTDEANWSIVPEAPNLFTEQ